MTEECFSSGFSIEIQYIPIQFVLELREPQGFSIEIQYIPIQFVLELQEPQGFLIEIQASPIQFILELRAPIILLIWRPPFLILAGGGERGGPSKLIRCSD